MFTVHDNNKQSSPSKPGQPETNDAAVNYVAATLHAWNQCPTIVKKQLDEQYLEIRTLREELRTATLKLNQKKQEFERTSAVEMKVQLMKHKDQIEAVCR